MTQLYETPFMNELIEQTKDYSNGNEVLAQVSRLAVQRGFRIYRHSVGPMAKEFRLLLMCG